MTVKKENILHTKKRENPFVQIDKAIFNNVNISWKAKGILGYLLSKPSDWQTYITDLEKRSTDGRDSTRNGIKELIEAGYIIRKEVREKGRFKGYEYFIYEVPVKSTEDGKTEIGKTEDGKTEIGKPHTTNNDLNNNDLNIKNISLQIENLRQRYSNDQLKTIDDYLEMIRHTRKSGKISESVILKMYESWNSYPTICVEYGLYVHTSNVKYHSKKENYTLGIIRGTTADEAERNLKKISSAEGKEQNGIIDYFADKEFDE